MSLESVTIQTPDGSAPPADHNAKMIAVVDAKAAESAAIDRPEWLPEKFKSAEEMAASYKELEAKLGGAQAAPVVAPVAPVVAPTAAAATVPPVSPLAVPKEAAAAVATAGLDMAELSAEFAKDGALSEANLAKLAAAGFDKTTVDTYIAGQQALATQFQNEVMAVTPGGAEKFPEMVEWAKVNLTPAEIDAYNSATSSGNKDTAKLAVAGLGARFSAAVGSEPNLQGGKPNAASGDVFESIAQMKVAMSDPRYKTDPAYRRSVGDRLNRSSIL